MSELDAICKEAVEWRRAIHGHPETGFEEIATSDSKLLAAYGNGNFSFIGNTPPGTHPGPNLHNPSYDFNDDALPFGVRYWIKLAEQRLAKSA